MFTTSSLDLREGKKNAIYYASYLVLCNIKNHIMKKNKLSSQLGIIYYLKIKVNA